MSKSKTALFSLGAKGTLSNALTFQKRGNRTLVRKKPIPKNPQSLAQMYHRWLYEDYAYLWRQQSQATQQEYRSEGAKKHLTGFSNWMSYQLTYLPDIAGMWHLDEAAGAVAHDFSRNQNHGIIVGASPAAGRIDGSQHFDGINDRITIPNSPTINLAGNITLLCFITFHNFNPWQMLIYKLALPTGGFQIVAHADTHPYFQFIDTLGATPWSHTGLGFAPALDTTYALAARFNGINCSLFMDGLLYEQNPTINNPAPCITDLSFAWNEVGFLASLTLDHVILYNRALDLTEILRHSSRRYPLQ